MAVRVWPFSPGNKMIGWKGKGDFLRAVRTLEAGSARIFLAAVDFFSATCADAMAEG